MKTFDKRKSENKHRKEERTNWPQNYGEKVREKSFSCLFKSVFFEVICIASFDILKSNLE